MSSLLDALEPDDREQLMHAAVAHSYARGDVVFWEGEPSYTLHVIERGRVAVRVTTPNGDVATLTVLGAGECFGELTMTEPTAVRSATIEALEDTDTVAIGRSAFDDLRRARPSVDRFLVAVLAAQVKRLTVQVVDALYQPAETRMVHRLRDLAATYDEGHRPVVVPLTQADIATMAGTTRPTANQVLKQLESRGALRVVRGRIEIVDPALLS